MLYTINYDLKNPGRNYDELYEAIKGLGAWAHPLESTWLVKTGKSASEISGVLKPHIDANDFLLVAGMTKDYQGWLPPAMWDWIRGHQEAAILA